MAIYKREDTGKALQIIKKGRIASVYLITGDRFLSRQVADKLVEILLGDTPSGQNVQVIDGDREDPFVTLNRLKTYGLFDGRQVFKVLDSRLLLSKSVAKAIWNKAVKAAAAKDLKMAGRFLRKIIHVGQIEVISPDDLLGLSVGKWQSAFGFPKPKESLAWVEGALAAVKEDPNKQTDSLGSDMADAYMAAFEIGIPENNVLILLAEEVDKRKKFFKFVKKEGVVFDLSVALGATKAAKSDQEKVLRGLVAETLKGFSKTIEPRALPVLLERIGFHPVAIVRETEKLALYVGDRPDVTLADVDAMIGRTREDALYELTESYDNRDLAKALTISARMLEGGVHPLVLVAGLRNHLRKLLLVCSFRKQDSPVFVDGMSFGTFQKGYLLQLKAEKGDLLKTLPNHPFALFMMFTKAGRLSGERLIKALKKLLEVEYCLKSSALPGQVVFEGFLFDMLGR